MCIESLYRTVRRRIAASIPRENTMEPSMSFTSEITREINPESHKLERQLAKNWYLLAGLTIVSTLGLIIAIAPVLGDKLAQVWPWDNTHIVLLAGLTACIGILIWHLTMQRGKINEVLGHMTRMQDDADTRGRQQRARLHALLNVSRMMGAVTDPKNIFQGITNTCLEIFECQQASLMIIKENTDELEVRAATGHLDGNKITDSSSNVGQGIAGWVAHHQRPLVLNPDTDMSKYPDLKLNNLNITAAMVVPIVTRNELVGVLNISTRVPDTTYTDDDVRAIEVFAENAGAFIRHSERAEWMRQVIDKHSRSHESASEKPLVTS